MWMHPPNEGRRSPRAGAYNKLMGVKRGVPDIIIFTPPPSDPDVRGVAIELKHGKSYPTKHQKEWLNRLKSIGWEARVCRGVGEAIDFIREMGYDEQVKPQQDSPVKGVSSGKIQKEL